MDCQCQRFCPFSPVCAGKNLVVSKIVCNFVSKIKKRQMGVRIYKISEYEHAAEIRQFDALCRILGELATQTGEEYVLVGNYNIEGVELDALLFTQHAVVVIEFKNWGGSIVAGENGPWTSDGRTIAGGAYGKSPFAQARLNRSRTAAGLRKYLGCERLEVGVVVVFSRDAEIEATGLSESVGKWLSVCDNRHLGAVLSRRSQGAILSSRSQGAQIFTAEQMRDIPRRLRIEAYDVQTAGEGLAGLHVESVATDLFEQVDQIPADIDIRLRYRLLSEVFHQAVEGKLQQSKTKFAGFFAKVDYLLTENRDKMRDASLSASVNAFRIRLRRLQNAPRRAQDAPEAVLTDEELRQSVDHDTAALCKFIALVCDSPVPAALDQRFPYVVASYYRPLYRKGSEMRVIIDTWDDTLITATDSETGESCRIYYRKADNPYALGDRAYLADILLKGEQLNLILPREEAGIIYPAIIIYNPDYLIDVTSLAGCFSEQETATPYAYMLRKLAPAFSNEAIMLGNFAGQLLDEEVYHVDRPYEKSMADFCARNAVSLAVTPLSDHFRADAELQRQHIRRAVQGALAEASSVTFRRDGKNTILEPSFFSPTLGLQARMDFIQKDLTLMVEQKSGKASYKSSPETPRIRPDHYVQALLYRAIFRYNYGVAYKDFHSYMLYSKYANSLLDIASAPDLLFKALRLRNQVAWLELLLTRGGFRILESLTPELVCPGESGTLWERYKRPQLQALLDRVRTATPLEKDYYYRFLTFVENEQMLSKVGNRTKEESGFASVWNSTLDERRNAGNIYCDLRMMPIRQVKGMPIERVEFAFADGQDKDVSNFRKGDIVFFYAYNPTLEGEPNATRHYVFRGSIVDIHETRVEVSLRNPQTQREVFDGEVWAIEHDFMESSYRALYQGLQLFLEARQERKDLLLLQRKPRVDTTLTLQGDYASQGNTEFNDLVLRVKQARDLFLIIGPPGTGKTSFGMVNVLKEQLMEEGTSVLLLSFTNRAVDEMCSKLVGEGIDFVRLGSELGCHEAYRSHLLGKRSEACRDGREIRQMIERCRVFCGTTTAFNSQIALLSIKHFDLAIVDEASQILEPQIVGLLSAKNARTGEHAIAKFVLIGDEKQLPAVVQQQESESMVQEPNLRAIHLTDCRLSLFERLIKAYRSEGVNNEYSYMLTRQGRMHREIAIFPNYAFYQNKLIPVPLPYQEEPTPLTSESNDGLEALLTTRRIAFVTYPEPRQTGLDPWQQETSDKVNLIEARMIAATVHRIYLMDPEGFDKDRTVGIIVPYRNQISTIRNEIDSYHIEPLHDIMIDTVERYQGSQCENIIYGFTIRKYYQLGFLTGNQYVDRASGEIIDRKLNVAMTRAMKHLIMIGNARLLRENVIFFKLMEFARNRQSYFDISPSDYVSGNFVVGAAGALGLLDSLGSCDGQRNTVFPVGELSSDETFDRTFRTVVEEPVKGDAMTRWPQYVLGNEFATNQALIDYGRSHFVQSKIIQTDLKDTSGRNRMRTFTPADQVLVYCHNMMPAHYACAKLMYGSVREWVEERLSSTSLRTISVHLGCGPSTNALAFMQVFGDKIGCLEYEAVDISERMHQMGERMLHAAYADRVVYHKLNHFEELNDDDWNALSSVPTVIFFHFSYIFAKIGPQSAEKLATRIASVMAAHPLNRYVFFIQQADADRSLKSYRVFRKALSARVHFLKVGCASAVWNADASQVQADASQVQADALAFPFSYEIWEG